MDRRDRGCPDGNIIWLRRYRGHTFVGREYYKNILAFLCTLGMLMSGGGNWAENTRISFSSLAGTASSSPDFLRPKIRLRREFFLSNFLPPWMPPPTSGSVFTPLLPSLTNPSSPDETLLKPSSPFLPLILSELFLSSSKILLA